MNIIADPVPFRSSWMSVGLKTGDPVHQLSSVPSVSPEERYYRERHHSHREQSCTIAVANRISQVEKDPLKRIRALLWR